jgi:hypothetical protein
MSDPLVVAFERDRRHRLVLIVAAVVGIVASVALGLAYALGGLGYVTGLTGPRNPAALGLFIAPFAASMLVGGAIYRVLRWRSA